MIATTFEGILDALGYWISLLSGYFFLFLFSPFFKSSTNCLYKQAIRFGFSENNQTDSIELLIIIQIQTIKKSEADKCVQALNSV